jgi:putative FmdB family regulatory protein
MPIYEYRCENGHTFEVMQRIADDPVTSCQTCSAPVQRVMYAPAVHFKGSGFYNTDYGTRKRSRELKEAGEGSSNGASGESDSDSSKKKEERAKGDSAAAKKPDAKPAAKSGE